MLHNGYRYPQSTFLVTYVILDSVYSWFKLIFENKYFRIHKFLCISLFYVTVVILETLARCHLLHMGSKNFSITKNNDNINILCLKSSL